MASKTLQLTSIKCTWEPYGDKIKINAISSFLSFKKKYEHSSN
jgi:hypothetical protein